jgi:hypothetical protein
MLIKNKKKKRVISKLEQTIIDKNSIIEGEELHITLRKTQKKEDSEDTTKQYELHEFLMNLNPHFIEESTPVKDAIDRIYRSDIKFQTNFDFSRMF